MGMGWGWNEVGRGLNVGRDRNGTGAGLESLIGAVEVPLMPFSASPHISVFRSTLTFCSTFARFSF